MCIELRGDFESYLREQAKCRNCDTYYGGCTCGHPKSEELAEQMRQCVGVPVARFTVDPNAEARYCELWQPESDWRAKMRRAYDMEIEEQHSAALHHAAVSRIKGYQHA